MGLSCTGLLKYSTESVSLAGCEGKYDANLATRNLKLNLRIKQSYIDIGRNMQRCCKSDRHAKPSLDMVVCIFDIKPKPIVITTWPVNQIYAMNLSFDCPAMTQPMHTGYCLQPVTMTPQL